MERPRIRRRLALASLWLAVFGALPLLIGDQIPSVLLEPSVELDGARRLGIAIDRNFAPLWRLLFAVLAFVSASGLVRQAVTTRDWTGEKVLGVVGMGLRRLLIATSVTAASAATTDGFAVALCILAGYPLSHALRRVFPPS